MKKLLCVLLGSLLLLSVFSCSAAAEPNSKISIAYISDVASLDSNSEKYVTSAFDEIKQYYEISYEVYTPASEAEIGDIVSKVLADPKYNLVIGSSYAVNSALKQQMTDETKALVSLLGTADEAGRCASVTFKTEESAFLAGLLAAMNSTSKTVGYVGGMNTQYEEYEAGFEAGARFLDPSVKVVTAYANSFNNVTDGYEAAQQVILAGADVIFANCAASAIGVERSCLEHGTKVISSDLYRLDSAVVIASTEKSYKNAAIYITDEFISALEDNRIANLLGNYRFGIEYNLVNISLAAGSDEAVNTAIADYRSYIRTGKLVVPKNAEELTSFMKNVNTIKTALGLTPDAAATDSTKKK